MPHAVDSFAAQGPALLMAAEAAASSSARGGASLAAAVSLCLMMPEAAAPEGAAAGAARAPSRRRRCHPHCPGQPAHGGAGDPSLPRSPTGQQSPSEKRAGTIVCAVCSPAADKPLIRARKQCPTLADAFPTMVLTQLLSESLQLSPRRFSSLAKSSHAVDVALHVVARSFWNHGAFVFHCGVL